MKELGQVLMDFFRKTHITYYICFIILYRFAEGFVMKIVPLFLKADREMGGLGLNERKSDFIMVRTELRPLCWVLCWQDIILLVGD